MSEKHMEWMCVKNALQGIGKLEVQDDVKGAAQCRGKGSADYIPADSSSFLHADHTPPRSSQMLVDTAFERAEAELSNNVSTSV